MNIKRTDKFTNKELWRIAHQKSIENQIKRKWNWIGHTLHKETGAIEKTALDWNPRGYRRRGRPKRTWRRTTEDEIQSTRRSRNEVKGIAGDRNAWKLLMDALCSTRSKRLWWWHGVVLVCVVTVMRTPNYVLPCCVSIISVGQVLPKLRFSSTCYHSTNSPYSHSHIYRRCCTVYILTS